MMGFCFWDTWHQLDHIQTICTSPQTDNDNNTSSLNFYRPDALPDPSQQCQSTEGKLSTNKALKSADYNRGKRTRQCYKVSNQLLMLHDVTKIKENYPKTFHPAIIIKHAQNIQEATSATLCLYAVVSCLGKNVMTTNTRNTQLEIPVPRPLHWSAALVSLHLWISFLFQTLLS